MFPFDDDAVTPAARVTFKPRGYKTPLPDAEAAGVLKRLTGYSTSALQTGLHILDTPGSIVRGGIGSLIGARPAAGERTSGRDLTDAIGLTDKYNKGWMHWGAGVGAEMLTDPLSYLTLGAHSALKPAGSALSKISATKGWGRRAMLEGFHGTDSGLRALGHTAEEIAHLVDGGKRIATPAMEQAVQKATGKALQPNTPLSGLFGFGVPLRGPSAILGTGRTAQKIAGGMDVLGTHLKYDTMLGRWANGLFDHNVSDSVGSATQQASAKYGIPALEAARTVGRDTTRSVSRELNAALGAGIPEGDLLRGARQATEGVRFKGVDPSAVPFAQRAGDIAHSAEAQQYAESLASGLPLQDAADPFVRYGPRQGNDIRSAQQIMAGQTPRTRLTNPQVIDRNNLPVVTGANFHRDPAYRGVPGGTEKINDLGKQFAGSTQAPAQIARIIKRDLWREAIAAGHPPSRDLVRQMRSKADELAEKLPGLPAEHSTHDIGIYSPNITQDVSRSAEQHARTMRTQATVYGMLGENARPRHMLGADAVPVSKVLDDLGLTHTRAADAAAGIPMEGALVRGYRSMAKQGAGMVDPFLLGKNTDLRKALDGFAVSRKHYDELLQSHGRWSMPEVLAEPGGVFRGLTSTFKNLAYPLWPSSHVRNSVSAGINNVAHGGTLKDHSIAEKIISGAATADDVRHFMPIPAGTKDAAAIEMARHEMYVHANIFGGHHGPADLDNHLASKLTSAVPGRITPELFGTSREADGNFFQHTAKVLGTAAKDTGAALKGQATHPLRNPFGTDGVFGMEGLWGATKDNPALKAGREVGGDVENLFRAAHYVSSRRQGMDAATAGKAVRDLHFDYNDLTKFEKKVMRQVVPFYTYMRKNLPLQAGYMAYTPGFPVTQMRLMQGGRGKEDYVPDYLAGGAAIPLGQQEGGNQRYISGFGTPLEEAMERLKFKNGMPDLQGTAFAYMGGMNPFIKAPLEQLFDRQFHTGRALSDLRAQGLAKQVGGLWGDDNPQVLAQVMANTPFTRFFSAFDKAADIRKPIWARALNLGTGVKVTDVNVEKQRAIEAAKARNDILSSMPHIAQYTNFYPRKGEEGNLKPEEIEMLRMLRTMQLEARDAHKKDGVLKRIGISY